LKFNGSGTEPPNPATWRQYLHRATEISKR
jgi:hypothetical protein